jgi:hypothetical protein
VGYFHLLKERLAWARRNPDWKPFKNLEAFCKKEGLNPAGIRGMIENRIGRRVNCECEILNDEKEV